MMLSEVLNDKQRVLTVIFEVGPQTAMVKTVKFKRVSSLPVQETMIFALLLDTFYVQLAVGLCLSFFRESLSF